MRALGQQVTAFYQARGKTWADDLPLIGLPDTPANAAYNEFILRQVPKGRIVARANTEGRINELVRRGIGIGFIDCFVGEPEAGLECLPGFGLTELPLWAVTHVEMRRSARVRAVLDFLAGLVASAPMHPAENE